MDEKTLNENVMRVICSLNAAIQQAGGDVDGIARTIIDDDMTVKELIIGVMANNKIKFVYKDK